MRRTIDLEKVVESVIMPKLDAKINELNEKLERLECQQEVAREKELNNRQDLTEEQRIIQEYGKGGRTKYLVDEEFARDSLIKAYDYYVNASSEKEKNGVKGDVLRWGNAYRGAGYDTTKVEKVIFDTVDEIYKSYDMVYPSGKTSNQMHYYSQESFKKLFYAMRVEGVVNIEENIKHWTGRRDRKYNQKKVEQQRQQRVRT